MQPLAPQQKPSPANCGPTLLVIEDEPDLAALLYENLTQLPARVSTANDGERGLALALSKSWDLIVLDLRMPRLGGLDVCREIRSSGSRVPILILTARGTELDRVLGLEIGADDYMTKPFSMIELQARIKAPISSQARRRWRRLRRVNRW
jgi:DNA-binding response OmpR family regulator